jgi:peptidoglycan hydrolase-like protein with peptidoglycan-binding domain
MSATAIVAISASSLLGLSSAAYVGHEVMRSNPEISGDTCTDMSGVPIEEAYADPSVGSIQQAIMEKADIEIIGGVDENFGQASCIALGMAQKALNITVDYKFGPESAAALGIDMNSLEPKSDLASSDGTIEDSNRLVSDSEDIECKNMDGEPAETGFAAPVVKTIQQALADRGYGRGGLDGKFLDLTCAEVIAFQAANGLHVDGIVGPATARELGIDYDLFKNDAASVAKSFDPTRDCPVSSSCDVTLNLNEQRLIVTNSEGEIWNVPLQSGKVGYETRSGQGKLGPVEYGENNNPERPSIDYPEAILVNPRAFGNGGQKIHGSYSFDPYALNNPDKGSAGCGRLAIGDSYTFAQMPTGTDVFVVGKKPGTEQKYF